MKTTALGASPPKQTKPRPHATRNRRQRRPQPSNRRAVDVSSRDIGDGIEFIERTVPAGTQVTLSGYLVSGAHGSHSVRSPGPQLGAPGSPPGAWEIPLTGPTLTSSGFTTGDPVVLSGWWTGAGVEINSITAAPPPQMPPRVVDLAQRRGVTIQAMQNPPDLLPTNRRLLEDGSLALIIRNRDAASAGYVFFASAYVPGAVEAVLRPLVGDALVVDRAPLPRTTVEAARKEVMADEDPNVIGAGSGMSESGTKQIQVETLVPSTRLDDLSRSYPPGLIRIDSWIRTAHEKKNHIGGVQ